MYFFTGQFFRVFAHFFSERILRRMKTYKAILLAVLGLIIVVTGAYVYMKGHKPVAKEIVSKGNFRTLEGQVTRMYEGENKLVYAFDVPTTATSTTSMEDALVKVTNNGSPYVALYMTYEGGRGYSSLDYINNLIVPHVSSLTIIGTTTIGSTIWTIAQSAQSEWHVGQVGDGQWLMIVETKRSEHDQTVELLQSLSTK